MAREKRGDNKRISKTNKKLAVLVNCAHHSLNLVGVHAAKENKQELPFPGQWKNFTCFFFFWYWKKCFRNKGSRGKKRPWNEWSKRASRKKIVPRVRKKHISRNTFGNGSYSPREFPPNRATAFWFEVLQFLLQIKKKQGDAHQQTCVKCEKGGMEALLITHMRLHTLWRAIDAFRSVGLNVIIEIAQTIVGAPPKKRSKSALFKMQCRLKNQCEEYVVGMTAIEDILPAVGDTIVF